MVNYSPEQVRKYLEVYERLSEVDKELDRIRSGKSGLFNFSGWRETYEASKEIPQRFISKRFKSKISRLERALKGLDFI